MLTTNDEGVKLLIGALENDDDYAIVNKDHILVVINNEGQIKVIDKNSQECIFVYKT